MSLVQRWAGFIRGVLSGWDRLRFRGAKRWLAHPQGLVRLPLATRPARVTRLICLLRGHGLVKKVAKTHRYQVTAKGRSAITALLAARQADTAKLAEAA